MNFKENIWNYNTNVQESVLILFLSIFFLLGAMKISDILPRRTRVKDKNTTPSVSQSVSYNVLCA